MTKRCPRCGGTFMRDQEGTFCLMCGNEPNKQQAPPCKPKRVTTRYDQRRAYKTGTTLGREKV